MVTGSRSLQIAWLAVRFEQGRKALTKTSHISCRLTVHLGHWGGGINLIGHQDTKIPHHYSRDS